jgi:CheY-like chemotaxis protein/anti-sigma regulatory factor (Ser/Thr protein kinase)
MAAAHKGLPVRCTVDPAVPDRIVTDPLRLRQILGNLLSNAVKFTASGEVRLSAAVLDEAPPGALRFVVEDTGIGMSDAVMQRLFAPFMQADGSTTRDFGGTGLGLCISRQLALLLGGELTVASVPGKGSAFSLILKLVPGPEETPERVERAAPVPQVCVAGKRVLVVDDDPTIRWLSQRQLEKLGFLADVARDGESALLRLAECRYDLMLTDCHMPRMDGVALTRAVRGSSDAILGALPIIGLTADVTEIQRARCLEAGMNDLAIKPMTVESLSILLQLHLPASMPAAEAATAPPALRQVAFDERIFLSIFEPGDHEGATWLTDWLQTARADLAELGALLAAADMDDALRAVIGTAAHRLAGSSFSVGAMRLGEAARALEHAAPHAGLPQLRAAHDAVIAELEAGASAIAAFLLAGTPARPAASAP